MLLADAVEAIGRQLPWFWPLVGAVLGGVCGSLVTCLRVRLPEGKSPWGPPSQCDSCGMRLTWPDLIPVVSCLIQRARCRHCGVSYGWEHAGIEGIFMLYGAGVAVLAQPGGLTPLVLVCGLTGMVLVQAGMAADMHKRHTPDPE